MSRALSSIAAVLFVALTRTADVHAQPLVTIDTVRVGDAGNTADSNGHGAVADVFAIGKYEVTVGQYTAFLNAVAATDTYLLYNPRMATDLNSAGITRAGSSGSFSYSAIYGTGNRPITYVSWFDAARFANWLQNGATAGADTENGAYSLFGHTSGIYTVNSDAKWFLPSEDQWYKAAYYQDNYGYWTYPTQSHEVPGNSDTLGPRDVTWANQANYDALFAGGLSWSHNYLTDVGIFINSASPYGTFDQAGNVMEWNDDGSDKRVRGGSWFDHADNMRRSFRDRLDPTFEDNDIGFRVASVPEPSTTALLLMAGGAWLFRKRLSCFF